MSELPIGWINIELKYLGEYINGRAFKPTEWKRSGLPIIRIQNLTNTSSIYNYSDKKHEEKYLVKNGNLLVAWSASLGAYIWKGEDAWLNQHIFKVIINDSVVKKEFLYYTIVNTIDELYKKTHGTGMVHVTKPVFESHIVNLPPLNEQKRIVGKLDKLLTQVDESKRRLEKIPIILKRFRQSVLNAAVTGELTKDWRERNENFISRTNYQLIDVINEKPRNGLSIKEVKHKTNIKSLTLTATTSGKFLSNHFKYLNIEIPKNSHLFLKKNDILIQRSNSLEYVGVSALYDGEDNEFIYPDLMMKIHPNQLVLPKYLFYHLSSLETRKYYRDNATGTAGNMPKINQKIVSNTPIEIPHIEEQKEIIKRVETLFKKADEIEERYKKAKAYVDKLTQSILAKAFRGELVPQDSNDEPAEKLLERIKAEKEKQITEKGKRKQGKEKVVKEIIKKHNKALKKLS